MLPFLHPSLLLWGLPLVGLPLLIHLINAVRHRRVKWAAMEFLLESQRRYRTWILLKQLLLLLLRMSALAALALMLAQPVLRPRWGALLGGRQTHHVVLLDDSYSMSDRSAGTTAFERAKRSLRRLSSEALQQNSPQRWTLLRFSRCGAAGSTSQPDITRETVDDAFAARFEKLLESLTVSETATGPAAALAAVERLPSKPEDETQVVYIVSDFRAREWDQAGPLRASLERLRRSESRIELVACVDEPRPNLSIADLAVSSGVRARGVPLPMTVSVHNYGTVPARNVTVKLEEDGHPRPAVVIENIPPGKTVARQFEVQFATAGDHRVSALLESDAVATDNSRYAVVPVAATAPALIIDGGPRAEDAYFVALALAPGGGVATGLAPKVEPVSYLRSAELNKFESIFLLNVPQLGDAEIDALTNFVRGGGGVAFFLGELCDADFYNRKLYQDGQGMFPVPLAGARQHLVDRIEKTPDLEITPHPVFAIFAGERNSFVQSINVERYFAVPKDWTPAAESRTKVIARLRNGAPLAVEKSVGQGRVIAVLTKAGPLPTPVGRWNNWAAGNPSFVVAMLEMHAYLSSGRHPQAALEVGRPLESHFPAHSYGNHARFVVPDGRATREVPLEAKLTPLGYLAKLDRTERSGFHSLELASLQGERAVREFAVNVAPEEGDLAMLDGPALAQKLQGVRYEFHRAADLELSSAQLAGVNLGRPLVYVLLVLLLAEQAMAYLASYHAPSRGGAR